MDRISRSVRSRVMAAVQSKDTRLESQFIELLKSGNLHGYTRYGSGVYGKPDFAFRKARLAIFVDSCFWHGCRWHCRMPATNQDYWRTKISRNRNRDRRVNHELRRVGWKVIRVWEHQLKTDSATDKVLEKIQLTLLDF